MKLFHAKTGISIDWIELLIIQYKKIYFEIVVGIDAIVENSKRINKVLKFKAIYKSTLHRSSKCFEVVYLFVNEVTEKVYFLRQKNIWLLIIKTEFGRD